MIWPRIKQFGKILASGGLFTCLGIGGFIYTLIIIPSLYLLPGGPEKRKFRAMRMIHHSFKLFVFGLEATGILKVNPQNLPTPEQSKGSLIISNHPSYLDIVIILALLPDAICVVKNEVWKNPFYGSLVRAAGFVPILDAEQALIEAEKALKNGRTLVIFPEGTRTRRRKSFKFQRGTAYLALKSQAPVLPLVMHVEPPLLEKGDKWYHVPLRTCQFMLRAEAFPDQELQIEPSAPLCLQARQWTAIMEAFYDRKLNGIRHYAP